MKSLLTEDQALHEKIIRGFCEEINGNGKPLVLKGGTAIRPCYGLDRFSEDIELDCGINIHLESFLNDAVRQIAKTLPELQGALVQAKKNSSSINRYILRYGTSQARLINIEVSHRSATDTKNALVVNGLLVYTIDELIRQKLSALSHCTTARDLHDVVFLAVNYFDQYDDRGRQCLQAINQNQGEFLRRFSEAYVNDSILTPRDLMNDLIALQTKLEAFGKDRPRPSMEQNDSPSP